MELAEAADAIGKSQKPESHEEQGDELVTNEQNKGKNGLEEEENLTKKKNDKDVKIYITVYEQRGGVSSPKPYGPYRSVEDFKKSFPNAKPVGNGEFMIYK